MKNTLKKRRAKGDVKVYRVNPLEKGNKELLRDKFGADIRDETVLLIKNPYEQKLVNIDFDIYIQYTNLPALMLSELKTITK